MREDYDALGFVPENTVRDRYISQNRYVLQYDERGRRVGYILCGAIKMGQAVSITQHCIQYEKRLKGYGEQAFRVLLDRCQRGGASSIHVRCADDLPSVQFWQSCGFVVRAVVPGGQARQRMIVVMDYPLELPLFRA